MVIDLQSGMSTLLKVLEVCGLISFACSGFIEARSKKMDLIGVIVVAFVTAFGGGTLRDLLLDRRPLYWVENQEYALMVFILALVAVPLVPHLRSAVAEKAIVIADAFGLGFFSILGTTFALEMDMPIFVCAMMGVITGIFGGVLRDILCNEVPMVFRGGQLYATCSFIGCWLYLILTMLDVPEMLTLGVSIAVIPTLRLLALRLNWKLPG